MIQSFRGIRIQEQPVPLQELLPPKRVRVWPFLVAALVIAGGVIAFLLARAGVESAAEPQLASAEPVSYALDAPVFERRFFEGDELIVTYAGQRYSLRIASIDDRVAIETPIGVTRFMLGEEGSIDLDRDNQSELVAFISDFQKGDASKGAVIKFTAGAALSLAQGTPTEPSPVADPGAAAIAPTADPSAVPAPAAAERPSTQEFVVFSGKRSPHPFVLNVTFRNYAMFRHEIDRKEREERYYHKGDQISVTANNSAKIWTSNAAACKVTIQASGGQSVDIELGSPGEVAVKILRWTQGDDGNWSLGLYDVD